MNTFDTSAIFFVCNHVTKYRYVVRGAMLVDNQAFKMAAARGVLDENIQYSDYFAGLEGPAKSRYKEKITGCGFDPYALRKMFFPKTSSFCRTFSIQIL